MFFKQGQLDLPDSPSKQPPVEIFNFNEEDDDPTQSQFQRNFSPTIKTVLKPRSKSKQNSLKYPRQDRRQTTQKIQTSSYNSHSIEKKQYHGHQPIQYEKEDSDNEDFQQDEKQLQLVEEQILSQRSQKKEKQNIKVQFAPGLNEDESKQRSSSIQKRRLQQQNKEIKLIQLYEPSQITDMRHFLNTPIPQGYLFQCTIIRHSGGMEYFYPKFNMYISETKQYLLSAKKMSLQRTSYYLLTMNQNFLTRKSKYFIGKIRSNFLGTEYNIFDDGENPAKSSQVDKYRAQHGLVLYKSNLLSAKKPRKMTVILPVIVNNRSKVIRPLTQDDGLKLEAENKNTKEAIFLLNKLPIWNEKVQGYVLNFTARVSRPSVKNFQLHDIKDPDNILLQFGRTGADTFNLDFQYPFTPLQAFSICITTFDYKLASE